MPIKLTEALLCLDCDVIHGVNENEVSVKFSAETGRSGACPACGSTHCWPISNWVRPVYARNTSEQPPRMPVHKYGRRLA